MRVSPIVWIYFLPPAIIAAILSFIGWWLGGVPFALIALYTLFFFRDPERKPPSIPGALVAPADGKIDEVTIVEHDDFPDGKAFKVGIFLSIFDVHVNRAPTAGTLVKRKRTPGSFISAMNPGSSDVNARNQLDFKTPFGPMIVIQIAGLVARRIISSIKLGQKVEHGQRIGLICFGSRTELFFPTNAVLKVKPGMRAKGGETVIAVMPGAAKTD